jgi:hypothetical protein
MEFIVTRGVVVVPIVAIAVFSMSRRRD